MFDFFLCKHTAYKVMVDKHTYNYLCTRVFQKFRTNFGHISKSVVCNVNLKTYLEKKNSGNYFDTKLDPICDTCAH